MTTESILMAILFFVIGAVIAYFFSLGKVKNLSSEKEKQAEEMLQKAEEKAKNIRRNAKNDAKQIIQDEREDLEKEFAKKQQSLADQERNLTKKELTLDQKIEAKERDLQEIKRKEEILDKEKTQTQLERGKLMERQNDISEKLEKVAGMTKDEAKAELVSVMEEEAKVDAAKMIQRVEEEANEEAEKRAKRILGIALQRFAGEFVAEQTITSVELPGDEIKGRLIGREGRNIRAFEQICGVDLIIDDTPGMVVISSFNVVRKQVARMTIEKLIADGRIHPAKIEEFHDKSKHELEQRLRELGEKAQMEIGIHGLHPEVLKMLGALNYRTSYMQNQYQHSLEVGFLCGAMAAELGLNIKQARRAGLLHDIGKAIDASAEGSHAVVGADFIKKYGEDPDIVHAVRAHHEDVKPETLLAHLVMAADALSGARPGVRKFLKESYVSRVTDIENIASSFDGVSKSYAISAGREIRVIVENEKIDDEQTVMLSRDIAKKIEEEMSYPGTIKVSVIRETRSVGIAK
ncbi:MAG: ribonuclease Y [Halobacteriovoraceae bacterium]|nr:ribonuclease Y [Halobacteriovoraceae bacterium]|tara:strand:- start:13252 stop:14811 length:1560 start_codon:yes stop_codon:yes gene_type:complete